MSEKAKGVTVTDSSGRPHEFSDAEGWVVRADGRLDVTRGNVMLGIIPAGAELAEPVASFAPGWNAVYLTAHLKLLDPDV